MRRALGLTLMVIGSSAFCIAGIVAVPEIDSSSTVSAVALLGGALLVLRARRKK